MSRSGYGDGDCDGWQIIMYRGRVASAIRGKRGQQLLREMLAALDAMPEKVLIAHELEKNGQYCALGVVGKSRGIALAEIDPDETEEVCRAFNIADALAREVVYMNDEAGYGVTPERRWVRMRAWVSEHLTDTGTDSATA